MVNILVPGEKRNYYVVEVDEDSFVENSKELVYFSERYSSLLRRNSQIDARELTFFGGTFGHEIKFYGDTTIYDGLTEFFDYVVSRAEKCGVNYALIQDMDFENGASGGKVSGLVQLMFD